MNLNRNVNSNKSIKEGNDQNRFLEDEHQNESLGNAVNEPTPIYTSDDSTLQTAEEYRRDKGGTPDREQSMDVSNDDLRETDADRKAGSDRAGTSERKDN